MTDVNELLTEIKDLAEIPDFARALKHKVEEMKLALSPYIHLHTEVKSIIRKWLGEKSPEIKGQPFELNRLGDYLWIPSFPDLPDNIDIYALLPEKLIKYIVSQDPTEGVIVMKKNFSLKSLKDRTFNLCYEKISSDYYVGLIEEHGGPKRTVHLPVNLDGGFGRIDTEDRYRLIKQLIHYLSTNDVFFQHIVCEFQTRWLPLLESQYMEINAE